MENAERPAGFSRRFVIIRSRRKDCRLGTTEFKVDGLGSAGCLANASVTVTFQQERLETRGDFSVAIMTGPKMKLAGPQEWRYSPFKTKSVWLQMTPRTQ